MNAIKIGHAWLESELRQSYYVILGTKESSDEACRCVPNEHENENEDTAHFFRLHRRRAEFSSSCEASPWKLAQVSSSSGSNWLTSHFLEQPTLFKSDLLHPTHDVKSTLGNEKWRQSNSKWTKFALGLLKRLNSRLDTRDVLTFHFSNDKALKKLITKVSFSKFCWTQEASFLLTYFD